MTKNNFLQKVSEEVYRNSKKAGNIVPINEKVLHMGNLCLVKKMPIRTKG